MGWGEIILSRNNDCFLCDVPEKNSFNNSFPVFMNDNHLSWVR